jgi:hypothetical protein
MSYRLEPFSYHANIRLLKCHHSVRFCPYGRGQRIAARTNQDDGRDFLIGTIRYSMAEIITNLAATPGQRMDDNYVK